MFDTKSKRAFLDQKTAQASPGEKLYYLTHSFICGKVFLKLVHLYQPVSKIIVKTRDCVYPPVFNKKSVRIILFIDIFLFYGTLVSMGT